MSISKYIDEDATHYNFIDTPYGVLRVYKHPLFEIPLEKEYPCTKSRWLNWVEKIKTSPVCMHFQDIEYGIECTANNCPCSLYQEDHRLQPIIDKD